MAPPVGSHNGRPQTLRTIKISDTQSVPPHMKFRQTSTKRAAPPTQVAPSTKQTPSAFLSILEGTGELPIDNHKPEIIQVLNMADYTHQTSSLVDVDSPIFQPFPTIINFRNYEPFKTYTATLFLRNNDGVPRRVKVAPIESAFFSVKLISKPKDATQKNSATTKVAPGMDIVYQIQFVPEERIDYSIDVVVITEREKFLVPVRALGARGCLDLPDEITFASCPIRNTSTKTLFVRNIGDAQADFKLNVVDGPFTVTPSYGSLKPDEGMQLDISFTPDVHSLEKAVLESAGVIHGEFVLDYRTGERVFLSLSGTVVESNVRLETDIVKFDATYINLFTQRKVKLVNRSENICHFDFKNTATEAEEDEERIARLELLTQEEDMELQQCQQRAVDELLSDDELALEIAEIRRKYRVKAQEVESDPMLFSHEAVKVEPATGDVWPESEVEITLTFCPEVAIAYEKTLYCAVSGRQSRLPLNVYGEGIGPKVILDYDVLDLGELFISTQNEYEIQLINRGDIEANFQVGTASTERFGSKFMFTPSTGILRVGQSLPILISFNPDALGEFSEDFPFVLQGAADPLVLSLRGNVVGPTFHFDKKSLSFGKVPYGFLSSQEITLHNDSEIPMKYTLRVPITDSVNPLIARGKGYETGDQAPINDAAAVAMSLAAEIESIEHERQEQFTLLPSVGQVLPHGKQVVKVEFVPLVVGEYDLRLVIDVEGVGTDLLAVPLTAACVVPEVTVSTEALEYNDCFIRHPYIKTMTLRNNGDFPARFQTLPQDDVTQLIATYETLPEAESGSAEDGPMSPSKAAARASQADVSYKRDISSSWRVIPPNGEIPVSVCFVAERLGTINLPLFVHINGMQGPPLSVTIQGKGIGPSVSVSHKEVNFGRIPVLTDYSKKIRLINNSLIPAEWKGFIKSKTSNFGINVKNGVIPPGGEADVVVSVALNDTRQFRDELFIFVTEGKDLVVPLLARGTGSTIFCEEDLSIIDLGDSHTHKTYTKEIVLQNRGTKPQMLQWTNVTQVEEDKKRGYGSSTKKQAAKDVEDLPPQYKPTFSILPDKFLLEPNTAVVFTVKAETTKAGSVSERFTCKTTINKNTSVIYDANVQANFIDPLLEYSAPSVDFQYIYSENSSLEPQRKTISLKNVSSLPLDFGLRCVNPSGAAPAFSIDTSEVSLEPQENVVVTITFDPASRTDHQSRLVQGKINVIYRDHPQRESVDLSADFAFPNLEFSQQDLDFGCLQNDTSKKISVNVRNYSTLPAEFTWSFVEEDSPTAPVQPVSASRKNLMINVQSVTDEDIPLNQVFDVLPIRGRLAPGESMPVEFTYYGHPNRSFKAACVCTVKGGPEYEVPLSGEASTIQGRLDRHVLDYGAINFDRLEEKELSIVNSGKVGFNFSVDVPPLEHSDEDGGAAMSVDDVCASILRVEPGDGYVGPMSKVQLKVAFRVGVPEVISRSFFVKIAHLEPEEIRVTGLGILPQATLSLPRANPKKFKRTLELAAQGLEQKLGKRRAILVKSNATPPGTGTMSRSSRTPSLSSAVSGSTLREDREKALAQVLLPKTLTDRDYEAEADRIELTEAIFQAVAEEDALDADSKTKKKKGMNMEKLVLGQYVCDFGNVMKGSYRKRTFRLTNVGPSSVTASFIKKAIQNTGFSIEPDRVQKLAPNDPNNDNVNFTVVYSATGRNVKLGPLEVDLPLNIRGGPTLTVLLRVNVTVPDVKMSMDNVDFGTITCGQCKAVYLQLHNYREIPCEWAIKRPLDNRKQAEQFTCIPDSGSIPPGGRKNVEIRFMPSKQGSIASKFTLKVTNNPRVHNLLLKGNAVEPQIRFDPPVLRLDPTQPLSNREQPDGNVNEETAVYSSFNTVTLFNDSDFPVEMYSLDFDTTYEKDEEMLRYANGYEDDVLLLPVRTPGSQLPDDVIQTYEDAKEQERLQAEAARRKEEGIEQETEQQEEEPVQAEGSPQNSAEEETGPRPFTAPPQDAALKPCAIVVEGPPMVGKSTVAKRLRDRYGLPLVTIDELVASLLEPSSDGTVSPDNVPEESEAVKKIRIAIESYVPPEEPTRPNTTEVVTAESSRPGTGRPATSGAVEQAENEEGEEEEGEKAELTPAPFELPPVRLPVDTLKEALVEALAHHRYRYGFIMDGLRTKHLDKNAQQPLESSSVVYDSEAEHDISAGDIACLVSAAWKEVAAQLALKALGMDQEDEGADDKVKNALRSSGADRIHLLYLQGKQETLVHRFKNGMAPQESVEAVAEDPKKAKGGDKKGTKGGKGGKGKDKEAEEVGGPVSDFIKAVVAANEAKSALLGRFKPPEVQRIDLEESSKDHSRGYDSESTRAESAIHASNSRLSRKFLGSVREFEVDGEGGDAANEAEGDVVSIESMMARIAAFFPHLSYVNVDADEEETPIPPPQIRQVVRRPLTRPQRHSAKHFKLDLVKETPEPAEGEEEADTSRSVAPHEDGNDANQSASRFVIPAHGKVTLKVEFAAEKAGQYNERLGFEVVTREGRELMLSCNAECTVPAISADYRNVFYKSRKVRSESTIVHKQYIINQEVFQFGPLLAGETRPSVDAGKDKGGKGKKNSSASPTGRRSPSADEQLPATSAVEEPVSETDNVARFRITNSGPFPVSVNLRFEEDTSAETFSVEPASLKLDVDQTRDIIVSAYPSEEREYADRLVCTIENNPLPTYFKVACIGSSPAVTLDSSSIDFGRLLHRQDETIPVKITNSSLLPIIWNILGASEEDLGPALTITPTSGQLQPKQDTMVFARFNPAGEVVNFSKELVVECSDILKKIQNKMPTPLKLRGESYNIDISPEFENGADGLDFGVQKVSENNKEVVTKRTITLNNGGSYAVEFEFNIKKEQTRSLFTTTSADPKEGRVPLHGFKGKVQAKSKQVIDVFLETSEEIELIQNKDITCHITDPETGHKGAKLIVQTSARSVFSKFRISPGRGLNFGAIIAGQPKSRKFDIGNEGEFPFDFSILQLRGGETPSEGDKKKGGASSGSLQMGDFVITPSSGTIAPSKEVTVTVEYKTETKQTQSIREFIGIHVSDCNPSVAPNGIQYELAVESCVPGIAASDWVSIFEEQTVVRRFDAFHPQKDVFSTEDKAFQFGPVIANSQSECRFRLTNPTKVPCDVNLTCKAKGSDSEGVFDVEPKKVHIPMHEHRYVTAYFNPRTIQNYSAVFEASVEGGHDPKTNVLTFELAGDGTLPQVVVDEPRTMTDDGAVLVDFGRLRVGKHRRKTIVLRNDGILPAVATLTATSLKAFDLSCGTQSTFTLDPKATKQLDVEFTPAGEETFEGKINIKVEKNDFEDVDIMLAGTGYREDVSFEDLPGGDEAGDELDFGDTPIGVARQLSFSLKNHTNIPRRFTWNVPEDFVVSPQIGHLLGNSSKTIMIEFAASKPCSLDKLQMMLNIQKIEYAEGATDLPEGGTLDWDDRMKSLKMVEIRDETADESKKRSAKGAKPKKEERVKTPDSRKSASDAGDEEKRYQQVLEVDPEPEHSVVEGGESELSLALTATADRLNYSCDTKSIAFKTTMMFQTRKYQFPFKNLSKVNMDFFWKVKRENANGQFEDDDGSILEVSPAFGTLQPQQSTTVTVAFSPLDVGAYRWHLVGEIPKLVPTDESEETATETVPAAPPTDRKGKDKKGAGAEKAQAEVKVVVPPPPVIEVVARSSRPLCHFELIPSDYLTSGRRRPELPGPGGEPGAAVDPQSRVIEFESLGTKVKNTKRFFVLNPTSVPYDFIWDCEDDPAAMMQGSFRCLSRKGTVTPGKKAEMIFEYTPSRDELQESFWKFRIPEHNISVSFLLVGHVKEPRVHLNRSFVNFKQLIVGGKARETIFMENEEHIPFAFMIDPASFSDAHDGGESAISFSVMSAVIPPNGKIPIEITFKPKHEKSFNYNVIFNVKRKASRVALNVKGEGYEIHDSVTLESAADRGKVIDVKSGHPTVIDFGQVQARERPIRMVTLTNTGKFKFEYNWAFPPNAMISIEPPRGGVESGQRAEIAVSFKADREASLKDYRAELQIANGRTYPFVVNAISKKPRLQFSFLEHDFGPCFISDGSAGSENSAATTHLRILNDDSSAISFDCLFENKSHLEVDAGPTVLQPGESCEVPITFRPREADLYRDVIPFEINALDTVKVVVQGEGAPMKVELANPAQSHVNLGAVRVGQGNLKSVKVVNRSKVSCRFSLVPISSSLRDDGVSVSPAGEVTLKPKESIVVDIRFQPLRRVPPFTEHLDMLVNGARLPVCMITGSGQGVEMKLESETLVFGMVVSKSRVTRRLQLENTGDVGTRFRWDAKQFQPNFSVVPAEGYLAPNDDIALEITFHPTHESNDIRRERIPMYIEGGETQYLSVSGMCRTVDNEATKLEFSAPVRQEQVKEVTIDNPTDTEWNLRPVIENEAWRAVEEVFSIPPKSKGTFKIAYKPLTMTQGQGSGHQGTLFFPLPNGEGRMYHLIGTATEPSAEGNVVFDVVAKKQTVKPLRVHNWLNRAQRFKVTIERQQVDAATLVKGHEYVDVPAGKEIEYRLSICAYKDGENKLRVTFKNEKTGEYLFYNVSIKASPAAVLDNIGFVAVVRRLVTRSISVKNPLDTDTTISFSCDNSAVQVPKPVSLGPQESKEVTVGYRPLLVGDTVSTLKGSSAELGIFLYDLNLRATAPGPEKSMTFRAALGSEASQTFRFVHFSLQKVDFDVSLSDEENFRVESSKVSAPPAGEQGQEVTLKVFFEPSALGERHCQLTVSSPVAGEYTCPCIGHCEPPRAQGPVMIKSGGSAQVTFKNVSNEQRTFTLAVDKPSFSLPKKSEVVPPKKSVTIAVSFKDSPGVSAMGKLIISTDGLPPWIYYLKGTA